MDSKTKQELNELSKQVFGKSSRWQKWVNKGIPEPFQKDRQVLIPNRNGTFTTKTFTDTKYVLKHYTVEEVRKFMEDVLSDRAAEAAAQAARVNAATPASGVVLADPSTSEAGLTVEAADGTVLRHVDGYGSIKW